MSYPDSVFQRFKRSSMCLNVSFFKVCCSQLQCYRFRQSTCIDEACHANILMLTHAVRIRLKSFFIQSKWRNILWTNYKLNFCEDCIQLVSGQVHVAMVLNFKPNTPKACFIAHAVRGDLMLHVVLMARGGRAVCESRCCARQLHKAFRRAAWLSRWNHFNFSAAPEKERHSRFRSRTSWGSPKIPAFSIYTITVCSIMRIAYA